jgi:hypothetical protein
MLIISHNADRLTPRTLPHDLHPHEQDSMLSSFFAIVHKNKK